MENETIAAIGTPLGAGGIGIIRISGPGAEEVLRRVFTGPADMETHRLYLGDVRDGAGRLLDRALAVVMRGPASYTGEDVAELQLHGGIKLLSGVLSAVLAAGARLATPGEFTLRAFLAGKLDLSQAEAVAGLIAAKTPRAVNLSAQQLRGGLRQAADELESDLNRIYADLIVGVDFPDDADAANAVEIGERLRLLLQRLKNDLLKGAGLGRACREGVRVVLLGRVNAGKSSLLNRLLAEERAIVTAQPGTTRDVLEESFDLEGVPVLLVDTAGLRQDVSDEAELLGVARSRAQMGLASLALVVLDAGQEPQPADFELLEQTQGRALVVLNKLDLCTTEQMQLWQQTLKHYINKEEIISISAKTGAGLDELRSALLRRILGGLDQESCSPLVANARQEQALQTCAACLEQALSGINAGLPLDVISVDIAQALSALGQISGKTVDEAVLEEIFSHFCLGK